MLYLLHFNKENNYESPYYILSHAEAENDMEV